MPEPSLTAAAPRIAPADSALAPHERLGAFIDGRERTDAHIVDVLIEERCPSYVRHWSWPLVRPCIQSALGYSKAVRWADDIKALPTGHACFDYLNRVLELEVIERGLANVPPTGRAVVISNHPTGLADGPAVLKALSKQRTDVEVFANADACRVNPRFADIIIPVEWVEEKRSPAKTRETLKRASESFAAERLLVIFPSGRLAHEVEGRLVDKDWFPTAVSLARKNRAPVTPLHVKARNSWLFYRLSKVSKELKDITLFHELMNKQGDRFDLTFGPQIPWERLAGDPQAVTDRLRAYVQDVLPNDPEKPFE
jgi:putative hemolysin